jgi:hypothetical protein
MSSREGFGVCQGTWPGGRFVVAGTGFQAAVQDADEAVAELAEGGVVAEAAGALLVVVGAGSGDAVSAEKAQASLSADGTANLGTSTRTYQPGRTAKNEQSS